MAVLPEHTVCPWDMLRVGKEFTVAETEVVLVQPEVVPEIVYVMFVVGEAVTLEPLLIFKPVDGAQL